MLGTYDPKSLGLKSFILYIICSLVLNPSVSTCHIHYILLNVLSLASCITTNCYKFAFVFLIIYVVHSNSHLSFTCLLINSLLMEVCPFVPSRAIKVICGPRGNGLTHL